jgi:hypothetical protein
MPFIYSGRLARVVGPEARFLLNGPLGLPCFFASVGTYAEEEGMGMTSDLLTNPQYWRDRAEEIRVLAERYIQPETKRMLENIVTDYERLARRAEERLRENRQDDRG